MEGYFAEKHNVKVASAIGNLAGAATTGGRVSLAGCDRVAFVVVLSSGAGPATVVASLVQSNAATGGTSKALNNFNPRYYKADPSTVFTKSGPVDDANGDASVDASATFTTAGGILIIEVLAEDLDRDNGFGYVELDLGSAGTGTKNGVVLAITSYDQAGPSYQNSI